MLSNRHESEDDYWTYNLRDCLYTRECGEKEQAALEQMGLSTVNEFQQALFWPVLQAMCRGVRVDKAARDALATELQDELAKREDYFRTILGHGLNPASPKQMQALFYEDLQERPIYSRAKKGFAPHITLDDEALVTIGQREPLWLPLIRAIQEYRSLNVFLSTFVLMPLDVDGRMRTSYNICGTVEYRFSSSKNAFGSGGNLQNVPMGGEDDDSDLVLPNVRKIFIPDPGYTFFDLDLSKADLRIVVRESGERELQAMLDEGRDPYVEAAREFHRDPTISKFRPSGEPHPVYKQFKSFAHGTHYLGTPKGLAQRLGLTVRDAERTQAWYFGKFPAIKKWQTSFTEEVKRTRRVKNAFGYQQIFFGRVDDAMVREAIAWLPASTVACVINRAWKAIYDAAPQIQVLLQVHDSLAGQFPTHRKSESLAEIASLAQVPIPYPEPLTIPVGLKMSEKSWGDCS